MFFSSEGRLKLAKATRVRVLASLFKLASSNLEAENAGTRRPTTGTPEQGPEEENKFEGGDKKTQSFLAPLFFFVGPSASPRRTQDKMASIDDKRSGMDEDKKEDEYSTGPLSVLMHSVKHNSQVWMYASVYSCL
jgi:hypothetical protein